MGKYLVPISGADCTDRAGRDTGDDRPTRHVAGDHRAGATIAPMPISTPAARLAPVPIKAKRRTIGPFT